MRTTLTVSTIALLALSLAGCAVAPTSTSGGTLAQDASTPPPPRSSGGGGNRMGQSSRNQDRGTQRSVDYPQQIWEQLQAHRAEIGARNMSNENFIVGHLADDESDYWGLQLQRGSEYIITGACDQDCSDIDLMITDSRGREIDSDTLVDDFPVLQFRAPNSGEYTLQVRMYVCDVEPCYYGFAVFRD